MPNQFQDTVNAVSRMSNDMQRAQSAVSSWADLFRTAATAGAGFEGMRRVFSDLIFEWAPIKAIQTVFTRNLYDLEAVTTRLADIHCEINELLFEYGKDLRGANELVKTRFLLLSHEQDLLVLQRGIIEQIAKVHKFWAYSMALTIGLTTRLYHEQQNFNRSIIEANAQYEFRNKLFATALNYQIKTGTSLQNVVRAYEAMTEYGLENKEDFKETLDIIVKLEYALELSARHTTQLAAIVKGQLNGSLREAADTIADIARNTALTANEAFDLYAEASKIYARFLPGFGGAEVERITKIISTYEEALKEIGGQSGTFSRLLERAATGQGAGLAGLLGLTPDFFKTSEGVRLFFERLRELSASFLGSGEQNIFMLESLASVLETDLDSMNKMALVLRRVSEQRQASTTLEEEWQKTIKATHDYVRMIGVSLTTMLQPALLNVIRWFNVLFEIVYRGVRLMSQTEWFVRLLGYALPAASILAIAALNKVIAKLIRLFVVSTGFAEAPLLGGIVKIKDYLKGLSVFGVTLGAVFAKLGPVLRMFITWLPRLFFGFGLVSFVGFTLYDFISGYFKRKEDDLNRKERNINSNFKVSFSKEQVARERFIQSIVDSDFDLNKMSAAVERLSRDIHQSKRPATWPVPLAPSQVQAMYAEAAKELRAIREELKTELPGIANTRFFGQQTREVTERLEAIEQLIKNFMDLADKAVRPVEEYIQRQLDIQDANSRRYNLDTLLRGAPPAATPNVTNRTY